MFENIYVRRKAHTTYYCLSIICTRYAVNDVYLSDNKITQERTMCERPLGFLVSLQQ